MIIFEDNTNDLMMTERLITTHIVPTKLAHNIIMGSGFVVAGSLSMAISRNDSYNITRLLCLDYVHLMKKLIM